MCNWEASGGMSHCECMPVVRQVVEVMQLAMRKACSWVGLTVWRRETGSVEAG